MLDILTMGELLVEIMREHVDDPLDRIGTFLGPFPSGAPAICIDTAARLGCKTAIIGGVGNDDFGKCLLERLNRDGVGTSRVLQSNKHSTGCAFVTYFKDGSRKFIFHMGNTPAVEAKAPSKIEDVKYMHIMGCSLMASKDYAKEILKTMQMAAAKGAKISFDPNIRKELYSEDFIHEIISDVMKHTSIFFPGVEELLLIMQETNIEDAVKKCFTYPKMEIVALKNGSKGSRIYTHNSMEENGVYKVLQKDATGAGDCYDGAFLAGIIQGKTPLEAAKMGAAAGALNAASFGPMEGKISQKTVKEMIEGTYHTV